MKRRYIAVNRLTGYPTKYRFWTLKGAARWLGKDWSIAGIQMGKRAGLFDIHELI